MKAQIYTFLLDTYVVFKEYYFDDFQTGRFGLDSDVNEWRIW